MKVTRVARPNAAMKAAIGMALVAPPRPTRGANTAPTENCNTPNKADALPATWTSTLASASAVALGTMKPKLQTITNNDASIPARPAPPSTTPSKAIAAMTITATPQVRSVWGDTRPTSLALT